MGRMEGNDQNESLLFSKWHNSSRLSISGTQLWNNDNKKEKKKLQKKKKIRKPFATPPTAANPCA